MIHAHHKSAAHADDGHNGCECVLPNVHDAYLSLGCAERCLDHRLEMHFFLQEVLRSALRRNCVEVFFLRVNVYSEAGKREQAFEKEVVEIGGGWLIKVLDTPGSAA